MIDTIRCGVGKHQWTGWTMESSGKKTGKMWCFRCNVAYGKPEEWNRDNLT